MLANHRREQISLVTVSELLTGHGKRRAGQPT